jgi:uncharacterized membrane protein
MSGAIERRIAALLRAGMAAAAIVVCAGAAWFLAAHGADPADYRTFHGAPGGLLVPPWLGEGRALMQLGILILVATPIARVVFSVGAFAGARDRAYAAIASIVLCTLLYSLLGGH